MTEQLEKRIVIAAVLLAAFCALSLAQSDIMPIDEVRAGMTGVVKTTRHGTEVVDVEAKVLGVLQNALGPGVHVILVTLTGDSVQFEGVANGMSGSPFLIDGKLVGALSTRIGYFSKEPIAGVTPIGAMLTTQFGGRSKPTVSLDFSLMWGGDPLVQELRQRLGMELPAHGKGDDKGRLASGLKPLSIILIRSAGRRALQTNPRRARL
jgi:hypothetical protein